MLSTTTSRNILAMTFRQVVLELLWNFQLVVFRPGTQRNMKDLENAREVCLCYLFVNLYNFGQLHYFLVKCNIISNLCSAGVT